MTERLRHGIALSKRKGLQIRKPCVLPGFGSSFGTNHCMTERIETTTILL